MATVYSLVCWGGRTGKSVTASNSSGLIFTTSATHGLRDKTEIVFSGTTPPGNVTFGTVYYAKSLSDTTFSIYTEASLTNRVAWSSAGSGVFAKSKKMLDYLTQYSGRWGASGSERCYDGIGSWVSGRAAASPLDAEVCELGEAFTETRSSDLSVNIPAGALRIESKINGVRTPAYHGGKVSAIGGSLYGYLLQCTYGYATSLSCPNLRTVIDGFTGTNTGTDYSPSIFSIAGLQSSALNMIAVGVSFARAAEAFTILGAMCSAINCIAVRHGNGFAFGAYTSGLMAANCTAVKCNAGFSGSSYNPTNAYLYNNISIGNTTNWTATVTGLSGTEKNASLTGECWLKSGGTRIDIGADWNTTSPLFMDYANDDFRPYKDGGGNLSTNSALIVDSGVQYYGAPLFDLADDERPNYNNGGSEGFDVGCYEFDHGYGNHPATATVTFSGVIAGTEIRVLTPARAEITGIESCSANQVLSWDLAYGTVLILFINEDYKLLELTYSPVAGTQSIPVQMDADDWFSNP